MRIGSGIVLLAFFLVQLAAADSKQQASEELVRHASEVSSPAAAMKGPYRIQYKLTFNGSSSGPIEGSYSRVWLSEKKWRREVSMPGYSEIAIQDGSSLWIERKPHLYEPQIVGELVGALALAAEVKLGPNEKISRVKEETDGTVQLRCVEIYRPNALPAMSHKSLCFDQNAGVLVRITDRDQHTEFSDFADQNGAMIARRIRHFHGKLMDSQAELLSLSSQSSPDANLLAHSADSRQFPNCDKNVTPGRLISKTPPEYPASARSAHQTGAVEMYGVIDVDDVPKDLEVVHGVSQLLDDSALEAIRKWRYEPYRCDNFPIRVETRIVVTFSLGSSP